MHSIIFVGLANGYQIDILSSIVGAVHAVSESDGIHLPPAHSLLSMYMCMLSYEMLLIELC